jgi:CubicO group peptidase (beta-lactamase class C family)
MGGLLFVLAIFSLRPEIYSLSKAWSLFDRDGIVVNFRSMNQFFLTHRVPRAPQPILLPHKEGTIVDSYAFAEEQRSVQAFLEKTWTTGFLVWKDGQIIHESYGLDQKPQDLAMSWSVSKSFLSALMGIAFDEGLIPDLGQTMGFYAPSLRQTAYAEIAVQDVLEMSSGLKFDEDYAYPFSDINLLGYFMALGWPMDLYMKTLDPEIPAGTQLRYMSPNTQALAMLLRAVTDQPLHEYFRKKLWHPLGAQEDAYWIRDRERVDLALGGLNASLQDLARLGVLYLQKGRWQGQQIVSQRWVDLSTRTRKPHLQPDRSPRPSSWGYGFQWWLPYAHEDEGDFCAIGVYGQFIYVNPRYQTVIVKTSAYPDYNKDGGLMEIESIALFRAIAQGTHAEKVARLPLSQKANL